MQKLDVAKFAQNYSPFDNSIWFELFGKPITREEVAQAIKEGALREEPCPVYSYGVGPEATRQDHIERVAYLAVHGWPDPVELDVGTPWGNLEWPVIDGNHRLAAAIFLGQPSVDANFSGDVEEIQNWTLES